MPPATTRLSVPPPFELWLVRLAQGGTEADVRLLDARERERAARFHFERDRHRYVDAHVALRHALAARTGRPAGALGFESGAFGKPRLAGEPRCAFSLSHSDELALIALADAGDIGVDLERVRALPDLDALAQQCLTAGERQELGALPLADRERAFLQLWTRKEACLKAIGTGLSVEPAAFAVGWQANETPVRIATASGPRDVLVQSVTLADDWVAALARVAIRPLGGISLVTGTL